MGIFRLILKIDVTMISSRFEVESFTLSLLSSSFGMVAIINVLYSFMNKLKCLLIHGAVLSSFSQIAQFFVTTYLIPKWVRSAIDESLQDEMYDSLWGISGLSHYTKNHSFISCMNGPFDIIRVDVRSMNVAINRNQICNIIKYGRQTVSD